MNTKILLRAEACRMHIAGHVREALVEVLPSVLSLRDARRDMYDAIMRAEKAANAGIDRPRATPADQVRIFLEQIATHAPLRSYGVIDKHGHVFLRDEDEPFAHIDHDALITAAEYARDEFATFYSPDIIGY